jgi:hypothetical protein
MPNYRLEHSCRELLVLTTVARLVVPFIYAIDVSESHVPREMEWRLHLSRTSRKIIFRYRFKIQQIRRLAEYLMRTRCFKNRIRVTLMIERVRTAISEHIANQNCCIGYERRNLQNCKRPAYGCRSKPRYTVKLLSWLTKGF